MGRPAPSVPLVAVWTEIPRYSSLTTPTRLSVTHGSEAGVPVSADGLPGAKWATSRANSPLLSGPSLKASTE